MTRRPGTTRCERRGGTGWGASASRRAGRRLPGWRERGDRLGPAEALAGDKLEVDALVAVLGVDHVRQLDRVKLLGHDAVDCEGEEGRQVSGRQHGDGESARECEGGRRGPTVDERDRHHVDPPVREPAGFLDEAVALEADPRHDLVRRPGVREVWRGGEQAETRASARRLARRKARNGVGRTPLPVRARERDLAARLLGARDEAAEDLELAERMAAAKGAGEGAGVRVGSGGAKAGENSRRTRA